MKKPTLLRNLLSVRKRGETDATLGMRLALTGPMAFYPLLLVGMILTNVGGEAGLGLTLGFWLFIGIAQWVYLLPAIGVALVKKKPIVARSLALGGAIIAVVNAAAWALGLYIGAR